MCAVSPAWVTSASARCQSPSAQNTVRSPSPPASPASAAGVKPSQNRRLACKDHGPGSRTRPHVLPSSAPSGSPIPGRWRTAPTPTSIRPRPPTSQRGDHPTRARRPIGIYPTSGDQPPTAATKRAAPCRLRKRRGLRSARHGDRPVPVTPLSWPDVPARIAEPGPASCIQMGSDAGIRCHWHLIVSFLLERVNEKVWSLGDSKPLTSCIPCLAVSSDGVALHRITAGQEGIGV
jgi:hypothetical protein